MNYAIILAGGSGTRFWPMSKADEPKQLLNLCSNKPMIDQTIERTRKIIPAERIYIATNKTLFRKMRRSALSGGIPVRNVFCEPHPKNTFAPIASLTKIIHDSDSQAIITVLACDHFIGKPTVFLRLLKDAASVAGWGFLVTLGARPTRPETGYGYIKAGSSFIVHRSSFCGCVANRKKGSLKAYKVERFVEKPDLEKAKTFLRDKRYLWNCGIFIFKSGDMLKQIENILPSAYKALMSVSSGMPLQGAWGKLPAESIDRAIMEKARDVAVLPADCGWADLGSWEALWSTLDKDKHGNVHKGNCLSLKNKNSFIWSEKGLVAAIGLQDIIVVNTTGALLVCRKDLSQEVRKIVGLLKKGDSNGR
jgi:mannose-1-phosphate guanylyltransferase